MAMKLPSGLMVSNVSITNNHRAYTTESMSGVVYATDSGIQWFSGDLELVASGYGAVRTLNGFLASLKGRSEVFELNLGGAYGMSLTELSQDPTLTRDHGVGSTTLSINMVGGEVPYGAIFMLPNDNKLYTLLGTTETPDTYHIVPALKKAQVSASKASFKEPVFTARLTTNETTIIHEGNGQIAKASIQWREAL